MVDSSRVSSASGLHMRKILSFFLLTAFLCSLAAQDKRGASTPEERQRAAAIAHKLEEAPLDKNLQQEREWAMRWVIEVPDVHVNICANSLGDFLSKKSKYKYESEIVSQMLLSSAAFVIEHPDQAADEQGQYLAAAQGALKAYESILKSRPDAHSKPLDGLLQQQKNGKLQETVQHSCSGEMQKTKIGV